DAEGLFVVVEPTIGLHGVVQRLLAGMTEGGMPEVVAERQCFGEILVEAEDPADRAGDLRHLDAVGQARPVVVALMVTEDLGLVLQSPERAGMDDAVAIALINRARRAFRLGNEAAARVGRATGAALEPIGGIRHGRTLRVGSAPRQRRPWVV